MTDKAALRAMISPPPLYPAPWRFAVHTHSDVACASGDTVARCVSREAADIVVAAVNEFATQAVADRGEVERALTTAFWGWVFAGDATATAKKTLSALAEAGYTVVGPVRIGFGE